MKRAFVRRLTLSSPGKSIRLPVFGVCSIFKLLEVKQKEPHLKIDPSTSYLSYTLNVIYERFEMGSVLW